MLSSIGLHSFKCPIPHQESRKNGGGFQLDTLDWRLRTALICSNGQTKTPPLLTGFYGERN